jgi:two-component system alkaline phosphatase synthesis response regulator PhoP
MTRVCVVEDEESLAEMIQLNLKIDGFEVDHFSNGKEAYEAIQSDSSYALLILDVMLPGMNGIELCRRVREESNVPVLFLSAKGTTTDRIEGLKAGGNDYLPKPFDLEELLLRVRVLTNTKLQTTEDEVMIGNWLINFKSYEATNTKTDSQLTLSRKEIELIRLFQEKENEVVSRSEILDRVWGKDQFPTTRTIDNFILQLRKYFEENPKEPKHFHSIRGVGYKFTS